MGELVSVDNDNMEIAWKYDELGVFPTLDKWKVAAKGADSSEITVSTHFDWLPDEKMTELIAKSPQPGATIEQFKKFVLEQRLPTKYVGLKDPLTKAMKDEL